MSMFPYHINPPAPYAVENPNLSAEYLIPNFLLPYLSSWRWDYRRTALLYALANLDGPALADFYRFALYYRALYSPQEVELLNLVALKLAGNRSYVTVAQRQFNLMLRNGMRFVKQWHREGRRQAHALAGAGLAGCGCGGRGRSCGCDGGFAFGVPYCHGYLSGSDVDDMLGDFDDMLGDDGSSLGGDDDWGMGTDDWGSGGDADDPGSDAWMKEMFGGDDDTSGAGDSGGSGWGEGGGAGWGDTDPAGDKKAQDDWEKTWGFNGKKKTPTKKKPSPTKKKKQPSTWWQTLPAILKTATDTASKAYCAVNPTNPMCTQGAGTIQNTPQWIAYCKQNANYPGCQTLLRTNNIPLPKTAAKTPPPPPGTGAGLVQQTSQWAQWYPIIGLVALAALGYLLLG